MGNTTSYQGEDRVFGEFKCSTCNRRWTSGYSWANTYQECKKCGNSVYPHTQTPLSTSMGSNLSDLRKPHPEELCEKCQRLGRHCAMDNDQNKSGCTIL